jgi:hypothetical protein
LALFLKAQPGKPFCSLLGLAGFRSQGTVKILLPIQHPTQIHEQMVREKEEAWNAIQAEEYKATVQAEIQLVLEKIDHLNKQCHDLSDVVNKAHGRHEIHKDR